MKNLKKLILSLVILTALLTCNQKISIAQSQANGEIININYQYKIAFTDLSDFHLDSGDIVEIYDGLNLLTHLKVSETTSVLSKLIAIDNGQFKTEIPFTDIKIGNRVVKSSSGTTINTAPMPSNTTQLPSSEPAKPANYGTYSSGSDLQQKYDRLNENYIILSNNLAKMLTEKNLSDNENSQLKQELEAAIIRIKELEENNSAIQKSLEEATVSGEKATCYKNVKKLEQTINTLKIKLQNMAKMVEGNINSNETR